MFKEDKDTNVNTMLDGYKLNSPVLNPIHSHDRLSSQSAGLFHQMTSNFFNEMTDDQAMSGEACTRIEHWLSQHSVEELEELNQIAKQHFLYEGITFTVYGESEGIERTIPYDLIPRVIAKQQWNKISLGSAQRVRALNLFLHDIYHQQDILKAKIIPELQVLTHEAYQPHMYEHRLKGQIYSQISGIDIIRDGQGEFYVLEDNLRTPSGVSYMLESRKISEKLMPDLMQKNHILGIEQYPQLLKEILAENAYVDQPFIVVLTPGRFNSAYYEHAFLAREMDVPLVTSRDLFVEHDKVYVKTIRGRQRVDVIYRRLDDAYLDPLCFMPNSTLGVAGLMSAYLSHNVVIANAPGTGVADDKSIYPYVDKMIQFYLGEKPILKNVPTYQCRNKQDLAYVLENLEQLVVKEAQGSGGYGMLIGPQACKSQIEQFRDKLMATPHLYIAQPTLELSVSPTMTESGVSERHIDLRPFVLSSPYRTEIVPGGLTRVAMKEGSLVVNSSQGGGIKTLGSWKTYIHKINKYEGRTMILLSTNAENIFWLGRYLTRTQYLCAQFPFTQDQPAMDYAHAFCLPAFDACSLNELILNPNNPASFNQQFQSAKSNVQDLRGILSAKAYAELNQFIKNATENTAYICDVVGECQDVLESEASDVFLFFSLGQMIEQLDRQIRLKQDAQNTLVEIENIVMLLKEMGWLNLAQAWLELKSQPDAMSFYHFSDYIQQLFEVDV